MGLFSFVKKVAAKVSHAASGVIKMGKKVGKEAFKVAKEGVKAAAPIVKKVATAAAPVVKKVATDVYGLAKKEVENIVNFPNNIFGLLSNPLFLAVAGIGGVVLLFIILKSR